MCTTMSKSLTIIAVRCPISLAATENASGACSLTLQIQIVIRERNFAVSVRKTVLEPMFFIVETFGTSHRNASRDKWPVCEFELFWAAAELPNIDLLTARNPTSGKQPLQCELLYVQDPMAPPEQTRERTLEVFLAHIEQRLGRK